MFNEIDEVLEELRGIPVEGECIKLGAKKDFNFDDLGKYFCALSNEANLKNKRYSWLVFGIKDKGNPRELVGTDYRNSVESLESLKKEVANQTTGNLTFIDIFEINKEGKRVLMFQIPPAPKGIPIAWKGHYYGRDGESLGALNIHELETIRKQSDRLDWSAQFLKDRQ